MITNNYEYISTSRRVVCFFSFLPSWFVEKIKEFGKLLEQIGNTLFLKKMWDIKVKNNSEVIVVPSFRKTRDKTKIWDIALEKAQNLTAKGTIVEFGMNNGGSVFYFYKHVPETIKIWGFDCFEGLPEKWGKADKGSMKGYGFPALLWNEYPEEQKKLIDEVKMGKGFPDPPQNNIFIERGLFSTSMPRWIKNGVPDDIILIHFDADLYMSTRPILDSVCGQIRYKYYILFDDFYSANHEFKAWLEFEDLFGCKWKFVAITADGCQALLEVN
jgi:hypothetical protein